MRVETSGISGPPCKGDARGVRARVHHAHRLERERRGCRRRHGREEPPARIALWVGFRHLLSRQVGDVIKISSRLIIIGQNITNNYREDYRTFYQKVISTKLGQKKCALFSHPSC